ncbi:MAG: GTP 3',8-cyclase MoaA [Termitinemataceae bacterium]|nr:MAG: GTP 3',8-cyclase MoaA [Termitinemataceae bacterium]
MQDAFGRKIDYLRVSITDRCNLRCIYCMPPTGVQWVQHNEVLSFEETLRICTVAASMGIEKIKVTGGEPLVRRGIIDFIRGLKKIHGIKTVSITTNALFLEKYLDNLVNAGLDAVNISLDTLNEKTFFKITKNSDFAQVMRSVDAVLKTNLNIKINCVPIKGINDDDIIPICKLASKNNITVRFIELMPLGFAADLCPIKESDVKDKIEKELGCLNPYNIKIGNGPAAYYSFKKFPGKIGFISALSCKFCAECNRMRLTGTGLLKPCLSSDVAVDVKGVIRSGGSDVDLQTAIGTALILKPQQHTFADVKQTTNMYKIGG